MSALRFFKTCFNLTQGMLRRQLWLLAGLALLCALLPLGAGRAAWQMLSRGVDFEGVTLALTSPEEDDTASLLERYMGGMEDIAQYCRIVAMDEEDAMDALAAGEITAALCLPERFIQRVMQGENPNLRLVVSGERPLESLLLLWVGQGASNILLAVQGGVYTVLDLYAENPPPGLDWERVVAEINLRYIALTLDRAGFFHQEEVPVTGVMPVPLHYALSLLAYFALSLSPLFMPLYTGGWVGFQRRLRCAGWGCGPGIASGVAVGALTLLVLVLPSLLLAGGGNPLFLAGAAALMAVFCSLFAALCCLAAGSAAGCGAAAFSISLLCLFLAGGVIPPVLLPNAVRRLSAWSPVAWLRQLAAWPMGYPVPALTWACLGLSAVGMAAAVFALYRRRVEREGGNP